MTRLSCHRFRSNEARLWLSVIAYNLGNFWRRLVLPLRVGNWSLTSLQQRLVKTGGRLIKHARYYWLMLAEGHLTRRLFGAMVQRIAALPVPAGQRLAAGRREPGEARRGDGEVSKKSPQMRPSRPLACREKPELALSWAAGVARDGKIKKTGPMGEVGCTIDGGQDAKTEIPVKIRKEGWFTWKRDTN